MTAVTAPDDIALAASAATHLFQRAPLAVVSANEGDAPLLGAWLATRLGAPLLLEADPTAERSPAATPSASPRETPTAGALRKLRTEVVVAVGGAAVPDRVQEVREVAVEDRPAPRDSGTTAPADGSEAAGRSGADDPGVPWWRRLGYLGLAPAPVDADLGDVDDLLQAARPGRAPSGAAVLVRQDGGGFAAATSAVAAGHRLVPFTGDDPRGDRTLRAWVPRQRAEAVVLLGRDGAFAGIDPQQLRWQLAVAQRGTELPGGGQLLFPDRRFVALYGNPETAALGVLGEQGPEAAVDRAQRLAADYQPYSDVPVLPAFEIIATVASATASPDGDYSHPAPMDLLETWVDAAGRAGVYVLLDLQPGRTDFLTQARMFEDLLRRPYVGLALDPEWRLEPDEVHLQQIGSVPIEEVNRVVAWLAELTRREALPQKMLLLHQFRLSMLPGRDRLDTPEELAIAIQMDGQGPQNVKLETWAAVTRDDPPDGVWFGWKNFYDEDVPTRSPADTMALDPKPVFVSYQ